ncbi:MAG: hypothetical protein ACREO3_00555, partial [Arenimonas sp.]
SLPRVRLLEALFAAHWDPLAPAASDRWFELAEIRLQRGDLAGASAAIARIASASVIAQLRTDRRFDALVDRDLPRFDLHAAAVAELAALRTRAARTPTLIAPRVAIMSTLMELGRDDEALAEADAMEADVAAAGPGRVAFDDQDEMVWVRDHRSIALLRLGRVDEAVAQMEAASQMREDGVPNVSQALNLAHVQSRRGRAADARIALARVGESLSGYGRMVQVQEEMRAALLEGDPVRSEVALAYLVVHAEDSPQIARLALVDANRLDEAAARLVADLAAPTTRPGALSDVQDFLVPPPLPADAEHRARWQRLLERADVRAAIDRVGRREHYEVYRWGDID